jgi:hypothetical protein
MPIATLCTRWVLATACLLGALPTAWGQAPVITAVSPRTNERAAPASGPVVVRFSQPLVPGSAAALHVFSSQQGGRLTQGATPAAVSGSTLQFGPATPLHAGEVVHYTVGTRAASAGGPLARPLVGQFTVAAAPATGLFAPGSDPGVGQGPVTVATGDVDGDGDLDLLTANFSGSAVSVRLNNGQGVFGGGSTVALAGDVRTLVLGDVDGDGDLDLLAPDYSNGTGASVNLRLNNGQGQFSGSQSIAVGIGSYAAALGDVDGDGDLDLLTTSTTFTTGAVRVHLNDGQGNFTSYQTVAVGANPLNLVLGDVDNDGDLDVLTGDANASTVSVRLNNGQGSFGGGSTVAVAGPPLNLVLGDVDGDYDLDVITTNPNINGTVSVRLNNGQGSFGGGSEILARSAAGVGSSGVALGDVDGDGDLDLLAANTDGAGAVLVRLNDGRGLFSGGQQVAVGRFSTYVVTGDVDGDGDLDLLTANGGDNTVSVRLNGGTSAPTLRLSGPVLLCSGQAQVLTAVGTPTPLAYRWSTGATTASITLTQPGLYTVTATFAGGQTASAQQLVVAPPTLPATAGGDATLCAGEEVVLQGPVGAGYTYQWPDGTTAATLRVRLPGTYTLQVNTGCRPQPVVWRVLAGACQPLPNVITPNGDGLNDRLVLPYAGALEVYSRWGRGAYRSADYRNDWGAEAAAGLYYYVLRTATATYKGWVEVVR